MKILAIDTSHGICSAALAEDGVVISSHSDPEPSKQAERLFATIDSMLQENNLSYADINAIAADIGPGSFTGIRIGLAASRGIAISANIPVIGITGFEALEFAAREAGIQSNLQIALDARRGQVFTQLFSSGTRGEELLLDYSDAAKIIGNQAVTIIGDGAKYLDIPEANIISSPNLPDAEMVAKVAFKHFKSGTYRHNPAPLYIRKPDAKLPKTIG